MKTTVVLTNNNNTNKTFDRTQASLTGQRRTDGSKSPAGVTLEVRQATPTNAIGTLHIMQTAGGNNTTTNNNHSFFTKKTFADHQPVVVVGEGSIDEEEMPPPGNQKILMSATKPSPIIVNKNQHFKYKMRREQQMLDGVAPINPP